jgi:transcriptional regulator with XRE-family HTH domain
MSTGSVSDFPYQTGHLGRVNSLKAIRTRLGLTLKQVADRIHTSEVSVSRYEREDSRLTLPLLRRLAAALGTSVAEIAGEQSQYSPEEIAVLEAYLRLTPQEREVVRRLIDGLAAAKEAARPFGNEGRGHG